MLYSRDQLIEDTELNWSIDKRLLCHSVHRNDIYSNIVNFNYECNEAISLSKLSYCKKN